MTINSRHVYVLVIVIARQFGPMSPPVRQFAGYVARRALAYGAARAAGSLGDAVGRRIGNYRFSFGRGRSRRSGGMRTIGPSVTAQRDGATRYRTGRRVGGRRARRFLYRMRRALLSDAPLQVYSALLKGADTAAAGTAQTAGIYLADMNTTAQGDIWNVFKDAFSLASATDAENDKLYIRSAHMDFQVKNTGTEQMFLDTYYVVARRDLDDTATLNTMLGQWLADMSQIGAVSLTDPALSLFSIPNFTRWFKVMKKTTQLLKPDECVSGSIGIKKPRQILGRQITEVSGALRGFTRAVLFTFRGVPENTASASGLTGWSASWSAQTTIHYSVVPHLGVGDAIGQTK